MHVENVGTMAHATYISNHTLHHFQNITTCFSGVTGKKK